MDGSSIAIDVEVTLPRLEKDHCRFLTRDEATLLKGVCIRPSVRPELTLLLFGLHREGNSTVLNNEGFPSTVCLFVSPSNSNNT